MRLRLIAVLAVAVLAGVGAFLAGRATRPGASASGSGVPSVALEPVEVDVPPLDRSGRLPALRREPREKAAATGGAGPAADAGPSATSAPPTQDAGAPAATSAPSAVATAAPQAPSGQGDELTTVGGGVE